jgi:hypothetical protein
MITNMKINSDASLEALERFPLPEDALSISVSDGADLCRLGKLLARVKVDELRLDIWHESEEFIEGCSALVAAALQNPHITALLVDGVYDWKNETLIGKALAKNTTLKLFTIGRSYIADLDPIGRALVVNGTLEKFCLGNVEIEEPAPLLAGIGVNNALKCVKLDIRFSHAAYLNALRGAFHYYPVIKHITARYGDLQADEPQLETEVFTRA